MGLKLKWFRRRITFDGIPPAPERNIRRKEATSGTVIGVYRQSTNFEDYIEPARTSYYEPPPQAIARATFRSSNPITTTSTSSTTSSSSTARTLPASATFTKSAPPVAPTVQATTISSVSRPVSVVGAVTDRADKIGYGAGNGALKLQTPPEPTYTPPQPPARKGLPKAKSVGSLANATPPTTIRSPMEDSNSSEDSSSGYMTSYELRTSRSIEVLSAPSPARVPPVVPIPRTTSSNSLPLREASSRSPPLARTPVEAEPDYIVPLAPEQPEAEPIYDSFEGIFERVKVRKPASPSSQRSAPATPTTTSPRSHHREAPVVVTDVPNPDMSPPPPKSILKKKAPIPPGLIEATSSMVEVDLRRSPVTIIPTPPPRSTRGTGGMEVDTFPKFETPSPEKSRKANSVPQMVPQIAHSVQDEDSDDDYNWDFVQKHRSSINQTVAAHTQVDPEVFRNAPASLRNGPATAFNRAEPVAQPRTLRGMRNQRARPQEVDNWDETKPSDGIAHPQTPPRGRASDSNVSETSA